MHLVYSTNTEQGYHRQRSWGRFVYLDHVGKRVRDRATVARLQSVGVPPAYTQVWYSAKEHGHVQATARDARGRTQYFYHPTWTAQQAHAKFDHLADVGHALPRLRRRVRKDLARRGATKERILAAVVRLLDTTYVRVGNEAYAQENHSYGLTTLRKRHLQTRDALPILLFTGKMGVQHRVPVHDARVIKVLHTCHELPGQYLFSFLEHSGAVRHVHSEDVNAYLADMSGISITAKDFRTWHASARVASYLAQRPESTVIARKKQITAALKDTAAALGNTPQVCRTSYVHPEILARYLAGHLSLPRHRNSRSELHADELLFLSLQLSH
jgi:DNA topoisomerase-1